MDGFIPGRGDGQVSQSRTDAYGARVYTAAGETRWGAFAALDPVENCYRDVSVILWLRGYGEFSLANTCKSRSQQAHCPI